MNPIDNWKAGPGSYNLSTDIKKQSMIYHNFPRAAIPKGHKFPDVYISDEHIKEKKCVESPPPNLYDPNIPILFQKSGAPMFGTTKRVDNFLLAQNRSPGPVYDMPKFSSTSVSFGPSLKKRNMRNMSKSQKIVLMTTGKNMTGSLSGKYGLGVDTRRLFEKKDNIPGPGTYGDIFSSGKNTSTKFSKGDRNIDVRTYKKSKQYLSSY